MISMLNILISIAPCIFIDVISLMSLSWGSQLYITLIETLVLEIVMIIFILIEICTTRRINERGEYSKISVEPNMSMLDKDQDESNENAEKALRAEALKRLIHMMKGNKGFLPNNNVEDGIEDDEPKRRNSLPAYENERETLSDRPRSYPLSPRTRQDMENPLINPLALGFDRDEDFWEPRDNVYAESKPPDPLGKIGKSYADGDTQTFVVGGDHDIPFRDEDSDEERGPRTKGKVGRGRGRRGRFEENIREENQFMDQDSDIGDEDELDVIKEEDDLVAAGLISDRQPKKDDQDDEDEKVKRLEDDLRKKIEEEDNQLLEEEKRLATNKTDDDFIKEAEEELSKSKHEFYSPAPNSSEKMDELNDTDVKLNPVAVNETSKNIDGMQIPPSPSKRTFNENDVKGELEKNEEGKYAPSVLPNGGMVDKYGRKVNEKGYLINDKGDIIDTKTDKHMFKNKELDENGDIPQPFKLERYNFNPHDIMGAYSIGNNGRPELHETPNGGLVDDSGKQVNEKGILIDEEGNVIDKYGRKKLDKNQLTNKGDIPPMLTYNGKQFKAQDVMGEFDKDPRGDIILEKDAQGNLVDKKGRRVNNKGYLIDKDGNIVDHKGNITWDKEHLHENEFPKIFPFSAFNPDTVTGHFNRDKNGNPILKPANKPGQFYDDDGSLVNNKGYLINKDGDIIDKNGNLVLKKNILKDGEIPPVFRNGIIRQDSATSLSRLMSEIDKNQDSDLDILKDQLEDFDEEEKGNTSVDSLMEDTPSNYNIANQRFDEAKYRAPPEARYNEDDEDYYDEDDGNEYEEGEEDEEDDNDSITGPVGVPMLNARQPKNKIVRRKKKKKKRKKKPKMEFEDPTAADVAMARAYGGQAKGKLVKKGRRRGSDRSTSSRASRAFSKPARKDQFFRMGGSVTGRDPSQKINTIRSDNSKTGVGKSNVDSRKLRKKQRGPNSKASNSDFEKLYDKNLDEFLENSEFDFESIGPPSRTMSRQGSARGENRLKGLESIYLQRLEANPAKKKGKKKRRRGPDGDFLGSELSEQDDLAGLIEDNYRKMKKKFAPTSARGRKKKKEYQEEDKPNIFTGNYTKYNDKLSEAN